MIRHKNKNPCLAAINTELGFTTDIHFSNNITFCARFNRFRTACGVIRIIRAVCVNVLPAWICRTASRVRGGRLSMLIPEGLQMLIRHLTQHVASRL